MVALGNDDLVFKYLTAMTLSLLTQIHKNSQRSSRATRNSDESAFGFILVDGDIIDILIFASATCLRLGTTR